MEKDGSRGVTKNVLSTMHRQLVRERKEEFTHWALPAGIELEGSRGTCRVQGMR